MDRLVQEFIREMKIASGVNKCRAAEAWNQVSGASRYTLDVNLEKGILYVTLNSSVARNQLYFQRGNDGFRPSRQQGDGDGVLFDIFLAGRCDRQNPGLAGAGCRNPQ